MALEGNLTLKVAHSRFVSCSCCLVSQAIQDMFGSPDNPDEERLECMVKLLQTCGKKLEQSVSPETAKVYKSSSEQFLLHMYQVTPIMCPPLPFFTRLSFFFLR